MMSQAPKAHHRRPRRPALSLAASTVGLAAMATAVVAGGSVGGMAAASTKRAASLTTIKIGYPLPNVQSVAMQLGVKNGVFKKDGLNVTAVSLGTSNVVNAALASGSVDYSIDGASSVITGVKKGAGIIVIGGYTTGTPVDLIVGKSFAKSHHLTTKSKPKAIVKALVGSNIGVSSPVIVQQEDVLLKGYGVQSTQVKTATVSSEATLTEELKNGNIDAFIAGPPVPEEAQAQGAGVVLLNSKNAAPWDAGNANLMLTANKAFATANPALSKKVVKAVHDAVEWVLKNPKKASSEATSLLTGATKAEIAKSLPLAGYSSCAKMTTGLWTKTVAFAISAGQIPAGSTAPEGTDWTNAYITGKCA